MTQTEGPLGGGHVVFFAPPSGASPAWWAPARWVGGWVLIAIIAVASPKGTSAADPPTIAQARGETMGTRYVVKIHAPPSTLPEDWRLRVDQELREVNDQMSTYLKSSEISRFNSSTSTDWFEVSPETAMVVAKALEVHRQSEGALDVTVMPLVNAWSFGPGKRTQSPPSEETLAEILRRVGSQHLSARQDPPAIRKAIPDLSIDLSAIAKGHGVDRVVELLHGLGAKDLFVEIGGEVRAKGDKGGEPWMVGLQQPDAKGDAVAKAIPLRDIAIATSGDYRNYFEHEGQRYSHTINPTDGRPVRHAAASVSILAGDCMTADAWATAINVLGPEEGVRVAKGVGLDVLLMVRRDDGTYGAVGTGALAAAAEQEIVTLVAPQENGTRPAADQGDSPPSTGSERAQAPAAAYKQATENQTAEQQAVEQQQTSRPKSYSDRLWAGAIPLGITAAMIVYAWMRARGRRRAS
jgi:thiamine biosynthesis lipoprotein